MSKPREFWIEEKTTLQTLVFDEETRETFKTNYLAGGLMIHVIEKSAYEKLSDELHHEQRRVLCSEQKAERLAEAVETEITIMTTAGYAGPAAALKKALKEYRGENE